MRRHALIACSLFALASCSDATAAPSICGISIYGIPNASYGTTRDSVTVGTTLQLEADGGTIDEANYYLCQRGTRVHAEWRSSDPLVATVDRHGLMIAVAPGSVTIFAVAGADSAQAEVTVVP